jgi:hypothetical protein
LEELRVAVGLTPSDAGLARLVIVDFKFFEDGVEQKITALSIESSGLKEAGIPPKGEPLPAAP